MKTPLIQLPSAQARRIWLHAQRLDTTEPFGSGPKATPAAVAHLGYLQIDTIYVIERSHHHILYTRMMRVWDVMMAALDDVDGVNLQIAVARRGCRRGLRAGAEGLGGVQALGMWPNSARLGGGELISSIK